MKTTLSRRQFTQTLLAGAAGVGLCPSLAAAAADDKGPFSFAVLGDLHYDKLEHHDLDALGKDKPDDLRQVRDYTRITADIMPKLFATVRETIADLNRTPGSRVAFTLQIGDLVEGLCGAEQRAMQQDAEALEFVRQANLGVPFLFIKGNHDITGVGAPEAFKELFHPFLGEQMATLAPPAKLTSARYAIEHGGVLFCFFDAYDKESLAWLEATLAKRTARLCFVFVHPPVVPYGARSTWTVFPGEKQKAQREKLLELLGKNNAYVLSGHIHKYNSVVRTTPGGGRFIQLGICSVIPKAEVQPTHGLSGVSQYNGDQVKVEPNFSPETEAERRAIYTAEAPFVKEFEYADLPGYAVVRVDGPKVGAKIYSGISRQVWRDLNLTQMLES